MLIFGQVNPGYALVDAKMAAIPVSSTTSIEAIAKYINANFKTESDKIRAVFYWTASNISYDVPGMYDVNFNETVPEKIAKTLKTKKGVCNHYAEVFNELSQKVDLTLSNLSILKTGKAKAIRFNTLEALCKVLDCQPGDILEYVK